MSAGLPDAVTTDTLLRGRVTLLQPVRGFRSSLDPLLLAAFVAPPYGRFVDIGCGTGALAFVLAATDPHATGVGVEIQPRLASLAVAGAARNAFAERLAIVNADVRHSLGRSPLDRRGFDLVVTNPPFRAVTDGPASPDPERAQANHELTLTLNDWLDCAEALLVPGGRVAVVYPAVRMDALCAGLTARGLVPARARMVHPRSDRPPSRVLLEARAGGGSPLIGSPPILDPPLGVHEADGRYSPEVRRMLGEPTAGP